jgi:hypothetical protein
MSRPTDGKQGDGPREGRLRALPPQQPESGAPPPRPSVRLRRELKLPTVAELLHEDAALRLPGQVRSAIRPLQEGDLARADAALPGTFGHVIPGPGHVARVRARRWPWYLAAVVASAVLGWLCG